jgi:dephospho-CoA kinase
MKHLLKLSLCNYIAGSGKSTIAKYLVDNHGFKEYALADGIYEIAEKYYGMKLKDRKLLHHIGEKLREFDPMLWISYTLERIKEDGHERVVITDTRKLLEMSYLKETGWENVMVYCDPKIAVKRILERDGHVDEELVLNSSLENQLRPLKDHMKVIENDIDFEEVKKEIDAFVKTLEENEKSYFTI